MQLASAGNGDAMNQASDEASALVLTTIRRAIRSAATRLPAALSQSRITSHQSPFTALKGCQSLQGLFRCNLLKTRNRGPQQVSRIRDVENASRHGFYSTMLPSRNPCNSLKTNDRRPCYSTINWGVGKNAFCEGREEFFAANLRAQLVTAATRLKREIRSST